MNQLVFADDNLIKILDIQLYLEAKCWEMSKLSTDSDYKNCVQSDMTLIMGWNLC